MLRRQQALSPTTFVSLRVQQTIVAAMLQALTQGHSEYPENRKGSKWLRVAVKCDPHGLGYFEFRDRTGMSVGHAVRRSVLAGWHPHWRRRFIDLEQVMLGIGDERLYAT